MKRIVSVMAGMSISLVIYLFYRTEKTLVNELMLSVLSIDTHLLIKRSIVHAVPLTDPIEFSLPGGLWVYCVTVLSNGFYIKISDYEMRAGLFPIVFALGLEFCQLLHFTRGTFDYWDVGCYLLSWLIADYSFRSPTMKQNLLSPFTSQSLVCLGCFVAVYLAHVNS